jgi:glyoxylase-like metal-dependent hydrolase (beta-lactamase superfamily II)
LSGRIFRRLNSKARFEPVEVATPLADGDLLDIAGGLRVLHTPGHSPGHVSLLHEPTSVLITGDAMFNVLGLRRSPGFLCSDVRMTERTAHVLGEVEYEIAAFTHGPEIRQRAREQVRRLLTRFERQPAG